MLSHASIGQSGMHLTEDSLGRELSRAIWRFLPSDIANGADTALDDSSWPLIKPALRVANDTAADGFKGVGWFRLHLDLDSTVAKEVLALRLKQYGASEIFIDGRLIHRYGNLTKDSAEGENPQDRPLILPQLSPGQHVLAIRYANPNYLSNYRKHNYSVAGFRASIWDAKSAVYYAYNQQSAILFICVLLFGIFVTLSLVHLILFLYYRADRANLRFSIFSACVAMALLILAMIRVSSAAAFLISLSDLGILDVSAMGLSLSALLNGLFSKRRWHFYIVLAACTSLIVFMLFFRHYVAIPLLLVLILIPLEALYILIDALRRRQEGARIIGGGLLMLVVLMLILIAVLLIQGDINLNEDTLIGQLLLITMALSILSIPISMSMYLAWRFSKVNRDLKKQLVQVEALNAKALEQELEKQRILETRQEELEQQVAERTANLRAEKQKSDDLLRNILPLEVAEELKEKGRSEARLYNDVSVLFTDFVDFTQRAETLSPGALVAEIDTCFKAFDDIIEKHGLEKIKTVGDAYIAVSGLPVENPSHARDVVAAALEIRSFISNRKETNPQSFSIRLGINSGPVVAGIVGVKKFAYDIWGDTVNTAARMEQHSETGKINISSTTYDLVKDTFRCTYRGQLEVKHKGQMNMYFVEG
jgi:class 3 adenylate cyclase